MSTRPLTGCLSLSNTSRHADTDAVIPNLLGAHTLSGCDTVSSFAGIGKETVVNRLMTFTPSSSAVNCPGGVKTGQSSDLFISPTVLQWIQIWGQRQASSLPHAVWKWVRWQWSLFMIEGGRLPTLGGICR